MSSDFDQTLSDDTFAIIKTQPIRMQGEHWSLVANCRQTLYFADCRGCEKYNLFKQQYSKIMPEPLKPRSNFCSVYKTHAAFHFFKSRKEGITGIHEVFVLLYK